MRREVGWPAVLVVVAAVAVTVVSTYLLASWPPPPPGSDVESSIGTSRADRTQVPDPEESPEESPGFSPGASPGATTLVVLGDSFSGGYGAYPGEEWPDLLGDALGWDVVNEAVPGSGYLKPGRDVPFGGRVDDVVAAGPDVVLLAGGINDLSEPTADVADAADDVVARLATALPDAVVVVVSPFSDGDPGPLTVALADALAEVAARHDAAYVDATRFLPDSAGDDVYGPDGFHPNEKGHRLLAEGIERALVELGVPARVR